MFKLNLPECSCLMGIYCQTNNYIVDYVGMALFFILIMNDIERKSN